METVPIAGERGAGTTPGGHGNAGVGAQAGARLTREQSKAHTRERLLNAARTVFARGGYHGATVDEIASEAGFSTGALYSNFDGKEDLFLALMEREIDAHAREIPAAVETRAIRSPSARGAGRGSG